MKARVGLGVTLLAGLFWLQSVARADTFNFTISVNALGCSYNPTGATAQFCANPISGNGTFTTTPLTNISPADHLGTQGWNYEITSISGQIGGYQMTLLPASIGVGLLQYIGDTLKVNTNGSIPFLANGQQWSLYQQGLPHPPGTDTGLYNYNLDGGEPINLQINVPEPGTLALLAFGMLILKLILSRQMTIARRDE